ncbi:hypothetical protein Tco_0248014, partial [Tanacetum coccineum]
MVDGYWCEDPEKIKEEVYRYYKSIFTECNKSRQYFRCDQVAKLSEDEAKSLEVVIEEKEIWDAVWHCGSDKAPGPHGFNFKYLKKFWEIIKCDLVGTVRWFWEKMEVSRGCNASFVTL